MAGESNFNMIQFNLWSDPNVLRISMQNSQNMSVKKNHAWLSSLQWHTAPFPLQKVVLSGRSGSFVKKIMLHHPLYNGIPHHPLCNGWLIRAIRIICKKNHARLPSLQIFTHLDDLDHFQVFCFIPVWLQILMIWIISRETYWEHIINNGWWVHFQHDPV